MRVMSKPRECVTHHSACDCREALFKELQAKLDKAIDALEYSSAQIVLYSKDKSWSHLDYALKGMQDVLKELKEGESDE